MWCSQSSWFHPRLHLLTHLFLLSVFATTILFSSFTILVCLPSSSFSYNSTLSYLLSPSCYFLILLFKPLFSLLLCSCFYCHPSPSFSFNSVLHVFIFPSLSPLFSFCFSLFSLFIPSFFSSSQLQLNHQTVVDLLIILELLPVTAKVQVKLDS